MEREQFDQFTKLVGAGASRRGALKTLAGGALAALWTGAAGARPPRAHAAPQQIDLIASLTQPTDPALGGNWPSWCTIGFPALSAVNALANPTKKRTLIAAKSAHP